MRNQPSLRQWLRRVRRRELNGGTVGTLEGLASGSGEEGVWNCVISRLVRDVAKISLVLW